MHDTTTILYHPVKENNVIQFNIGFLTPKIWLFAISGMGHTWAGPLVAKWPPPGLHN